MNRKLWPNEEKVAVAMDTSGYRRELYRQQIYTKILGTKLETIL